MPRFESTSRPAVLVVDDDSLIRESLASLLRATGCDVTECANVDDALELTASHRYALAVVDAHLQPAGTERSGLTLAARLANDLSHKVENVMALSADKSPRMRSDCARYGLELLAKSDGLPALAKRLRAVLGL
jgi:CheY-like chemotaxis protein